MPHSPVCSLFYWRILNVLAIVTFAMTAYAQMPIAQDSLLKLLQSNNSKDSNRVLILNRLAFANYYNNPTAALQYGYEAQKIADSLRFTKGEAEAFRQVGLAFWAQADMTTAINYYLTGLRIAEANKHLQVQADILSNIGAAYNGLGDPKEALTFFNRSIALQRQLKNLWREAAVLNNVGDAYIALKDFDKAREAYSTALLRSKEQNYLLGVATNTRNIGNVLEHKGLYDSAFVNYEKCAEIAKQINDNRNYILSNKSMASISIKTNRLQEAELYLKRGLEAALAANLRSFIRDIYQLMATLKEKQGRQSDAFSYFKLFAAYKDSVQNMAAVSEVASQRLRYETEKKQTEIELLKKDADIKRAELSSRNELLIASTVTLLLALVLLVVSIRSYGNIQKKNKLLLDKNEEISKQHLRLSELNDELITLNEEMRSQQEEVMAQRDELELQNKRIEQMHAKLLNANETLELAVKERTAALEVQNKILTDYAFINAHKLRSPLASIMGLVNLLLHRKYDAETQELLVHLQTSSEQLDKVIRSISKTIDKGLDAFDPNKPIS